MLTLRLRRGLLMVFGAGILLACKPAGAPESEGQTAAPSPGDVQEAANSAAASEGGAPVAVAATGPAGALAPPQPPLDERGIKIREEIRERIEGGGRPLSLIIEGEPVMAKTVLPDAYAAVALRPLWVTGDGPRPAVAELTTALKALHEDGLSLGHYHVGAIEARARATTPAALAELDVLCTDAFLLAGSHLLMGRVDPATLDAHWHANRRGAKLADVLHKAVATGEIEKTLDGLRPAYPEYKALKSVLKKLRTLDAAGGWPEVHAELKEGQKSSEVKNLRRRLHLDPGVKLSEGEVFDADTTEALKAFQARHGLPQKGVVDANTLVALNVPVPDRIKTVVANLERWRWLPQDLGKRHILVNIAGFWLRYNDDGKLAGEMKVVVGKPFRKTPVFSERLQYAVFNPQWSVPHKIASRDILPKVKKNKNYLTENGIRIYRKDGEGGPLDPSSIDWDSLTSKRFPYKLRQNAGGENALGKVKFMFPNVYNVYLHDTNKKLLFFKDERAVSSGCIRLEKPITLAKWVFAPHKTGEDVERIVDRKVEAAVYLEDEVWVHLLYWTAWMDGDALQVRKDVYRRDRPLLAALEKFEPI